MRPGHAKENRILVLLSEPRVGEASRVELRKEGGVEERVDE